MSGEVSDSARPRRSSIPGWGPISRAGPEAEADTKAGCEYAAERRRDCMVVGGRAWRVDLGHGKVESSRNGAKTERLRRKP
jgi:hypothetical protein